MKFNSPFLYLFFWSLFLLSCTTNDRLKPTETEKAISHQLEEATKATSLAAKTKHAEEAIRLAKNSNNTSMEYKAVLYKLDHCIAPTYPDSTSFYLNHLLNLASKTENAKAATAYIIAKQGDDAISSKDYQKAYGFYDQSKKIYQEEKDSLMAGYNLLKMANIQQIYNDYSGSEETLTEALVFLENSKDAQPYVREANNMMGIAYAGTKNYSEAIKYYNQAKKITDDPISQKIIDNNIALCYFEEANYEEAIKRFAVLYESDIIQKDTTTLAKVADNLGFSKFKNDGRSGQELMEQALAIRTKQADKKGMVYSYLNLSHFHGSKNPSLALDYAQKAYSIATEIGAIDHRLQALELLSTLGDRSYNEHYFRLNDSIDNFRQKGRNQFAKMRFDATKERNKSQALEVKQARDKVRNLVVGIILVGFIILIIALYFKDKRKHKIEKQRQKREEEYRTETRIAKKLHDELANDIFNTMNFAEIRDLATAENKEILLENLDKIYAQTRNISKENNNIDTGEKYLNNLKDMLSGYGSEEVNILLNDIESIDWPAIDASKKIVAYRVLQELLVNMKKHSKANVVVIGFKKINKKIQINYLDNGVGMGLDGHYIKNGLQNVENRIQSINGTITFDPKPMKGFRVHFSFNA